MHFLHIGKTGGSAIKAGLGPLADVGRYEIVLHEHDVGLSQIPAGEKLFFAVRDPLERFVSGFNSRQRRGRPRYDVPWTRQEKRAFERFRTADSLAVALSADDGSERAAAREAMMSIGHVRDSYWRWFRDRDYLDTRVDDLLLIMWLPDLDSAFVRLCEVLGLAGRTELPRDDVAAHRNPVSADRRLGDRAVENLTAWYSSDFAFVEFCTRLGCFTSGRAGR